jgi:long-chain acyl-CoA synthetase
LITHNHSYLSLLQVAVPKIWDTIKKGILGKVSAGSPITQFLVKTAFEWRGFALKHGFDTPLFKALVFKKFAHAVGGKLRLGLSGGGPLNTDVQDFCRTAFGCALVQGYVSTISIKETINEATHAWSPAMCSRSTTLFTTT